MQIEPLDVPLMHGRIAIGAAALSHALFATFVVGSALIGAATATIGHVTNQRRYERLAYMIAFALVLTTATISFLGVVLIFMLNIYWPRFWHTIFHIMFWPFILEGSLFFGEAVFAYAWYYLWEWGSGPDASPRRKLVHLSFGWTAAVCALTAMFLIDITASYMLTPHPVDSAWRNIFNPTMIHLDLHRWFGNLTWTGFALAGVCAIAWFRSRVPLDREHYQWAAGYCFMIGFGALLIMPIIGYQYLLNVRYGQPQAFQVLMLGARSWLFDLVALLYGLLIILGSLYIARIVRSHRDRPVSSDTFLPISLLIIGVAAVVFAMPYHLQHIPFISLLTDREINPWGKMQPNKYYAIALLVMFGLVNLIYFVRAYRLRAAASPSHDRIAPSLLIALAACSVLIMLAMGWTRETARAVDGYLIYGQFSFEDERPTYGSPP